MAKLLLSAGSVFSSTSEADIMPKMAMALGIDKNDLVLESKSKDTKDQASFIHNIIGNDKFILVTSASHMARSFPFFNQKECIPYRPPTGYRVKKMEKISPTTFYPSSKGIDKMERVVYEYTGTTWAKLRGQIN